MDPSPSISAVASAGQDRRRVPLDSAPINYGSTTSVALSDDDVYDGGGGDACAPLSASSQRRRIEAQSAAAATCDFVASSGLNGLTYGIWGLLDMLMMVTMAARLPTGDAFAGAATAITLTAMAALSVASGMSSALETLIAAAFGADEFSVHISRFLYAATAVNIGLLYLPIAVACVAVPAPWLRALLPGASDLMLEALVLWLRWAPLPMLPQVFSMGLQKFAICQRRPAVVTRSAAVSLVCLPLLLWLAARGGGDEGLTRKSSEEGARGMFDGFGGGGSLLAFVAAITADKTIMLLVLVGSILRDDVLRRNVWGHGSGGVHVHTHVHTSSYNKETHSSNGHNTLNLNNQRQNHHQEREEEELGERSALISGNRSASRPHQQPRPRREAAGWMGGGDEGDHDATADNTTEEGMLIDEALGRIAHGGPLHTASASEAIVLANDDDEKENEVEEGSSPLKMSQSGSSPLRPFGFYLVSYLRVGYPSAIAFCIDTWTFELMTILSARCGPTQAAAWVLMQQLTSPIFALAAGLSSAAAADVGQALGAGCAPSTVTRRVRIAVYSSFAIGAATLVAVILFGAPLFSALVAMAEGSRPTTTGGSPSSASTYSSTLAAAIGVEAMPLFAVHLATDVPFFALQGVYRGLGRQGLQAKLVFVSLWVIAVPLAALWPRLYSALLAQLGGGESASTDGNNHLFGIGMGGGCVQGIVVGLVAGTTIGSLLLYRCLDASAYTLLLADATPSPTATPGSGGFFGGWRQRSPSDGGDGDIPVEGGSQAKTTLDRCFHGALRKIQMMRGSQSVAGVGDSAAHAAPTAATPHRRDGGPPPSPPFAFATTRGGISFGTKGNALRDDMANSINRREHKY